MDWIQFTLLYVTILGFIASFIGLFMWTRSEANADRREIMNLMNIIQEEIKDFHGRLCTIEERHRHK